MFAQLSFSLVLGTACLLFGGEVAAAAQPASPLTAGTRVRVTLLERAPAPALSGGERLRAGGTYIGRLLAFQADSLVLETADDAGTRLALRREAIAKLEISHGRRSRAGRGALLGLIGGGVGGALLGGSILATNREAQGFEPVVLGFGGAFVGLGLGALVGSLIHVEGWRSVPPDEPPAP